MNKFRNFILAVLIFIPMVASFAHAKSGFNGSGGSDGELPKSTLNAGDIAALLSLDAPLTLKSILNQWEIAIRENYAHELYPIPTSIMNTQRRLMPTAKPNLRDIVDHFFIKRQADGSPRFVVLSRQDGACQDLISDTTIPLEACFCQDRKGEKKVATYFFNLGTHIDSERMCFSADMILEKFADINAFGVTGYLSAVIAHEAAHALTQEEDESAEAEFTRLENFLKRHITLDDYSLYRIMAAEKTAIANSLLLAQQSAQEALQTIAEGDHQKICRAILKFQQTTNQIKDRHLKNSHYVSFSQIIYTSDFQSAQAANLMHQKASLFRAYCDSRSQFDIQRHFHKGENEVSSEEFQKRLSHNIKPDEGAYVQKPRCFEIPAAGVIRRPRLGKFATLSLELKDILKELDFILMNQKDVLEAHSLRKKVIPKARRLKQWN